MSRGENEYVTPVLHKDNKKLKEKQKATQGTA